MEFTLFDFATSELSHSGYFAWLIKQIDPQANGYSLEVQTTGLEVVNEMLALSSVSTIATLEDVDRCEVVTEKSIPGCRFDIVAFLRLKSGRNIQIIIENKLGAQESSPDQLERYLKRGQEVINPKFQWKDPERHFVYLKADYDYEYLPGSLHDSAGAELPQFRMFNWRRLNDIFGKKEFFDSILKSYSQWISDKHESISKKLIVQNLLSPEQGSELLNDHIGQVTLLKHIFPELLKNKVKNVKKDSLGYHRYYYEGDKIYLIVGTDRGTPWTQLWGWDVRGMDLYYRLQCRFRKGSPEPRLEVKVYNQQEKKDQSVMEKLKEIEKHHYDLIQELNLEDIRLNKRASGGKRELTINSFRLIGTDVTKLQQIENLHEKFLETVGGKP